MAPTAPTAPIKAHIIPMPHSCPPHAPRPMLQEAIHSTMAVKRVLKSGGWLARLLTAAAGQKMSDMVTMWVRAGQGRVRHPSSFHLIGLGLGLGLGGSGTPAHFI